MIVLGLSFWDIPPFLGNILIHMTSHLMNSRCIVQGIILNGSDAIAALLHSSNTWIARSTYGTCSFFTVVLSLMRFSNSISCILSNSLSIRRKCTLKPQCLYSFRTRSMHSMIFFCFLFVMSSMVIKRIFLDIITKMILLLTKVMSAHNVISLWCSNISHGNGIIIDVWTTFDLSLVILSCKAKISGLNISTACLASFKVIGQFGSM